MRRISGWVTLAAVVMASIAVALPATAAVETPVHEVIHQFHPNSVRASGLIQASDGDLVTDSDGVASVAVPLAHRGNNRSYEAVFSGDDLYGASSDEQLGEGGGRDIAI